MTLGTNPVGYILLSTQFHLCATCERWTGMTCGITAFTSPDSNMRRSPLASLWYFYESIWLCKEFPCAPFSRIYQSRFFYMVAFSEQLEMSSDLVYHAFGRRSNAQHRCASTCYLSPSRIVNDMCHKSQTHRLRLQYFELLLTLDL